MSKIIPAFNKNAIGYMPKSLVLATLPHRDPGACNYKRINGAHRLTILANDEIGLPYGVIPRLLLIWITTHAVKRKTRDITLDKSLSAFLKSVGITNTGLNIKRFREQARRLFYASINITSIVNDTINHLQPAKTAYFFQEEGSGICLTEDFYNEVLKSVVPINLDAINTLKNSSLGLDIYIWLTHRVSYLDKKTLVTWRQLQDQFGSDYAKNKTGKQSFKRAFDKQVMKILTIYSDVRIQKTEGGIIIEPSKTHVDKSCG